MKNTARITSILNTPTLDSSITGFHTFDLSNLTLETDIDFPIPSGLRLGHVAEKIVSTLIKSSSNYVVLYENIQLIEQKQTIGEIDFILSDQQTQQIIHLELAYKFYLYDPSISSEPLHNWIGPNRNDSLKEKLDKLRTKQFPLLYHYATQAKLEQVDPKDISQQLCLLASLFIPYNDKTSFPANYQKAIKGYYLTRKAFIEMDHSERFYYIPPKSAWGIDPSENTHWESFDEVYPQIRNHMAAKQAPLCWQKYRDSYAAIFIVWW